MTRHHPLAEPVLAVTQDAITTDLSFICSLFCMLVWSRAFGALSRGNRPTTTLLRAQRIELPSLQVHGPLARRLLSQRAPKPLKKPSKHEHNRNSPKPFTGSQGLGAMGSSLKLGKSNLYTMTSSLITNSLSSSQAIQSVSSSTTLAAARLSSSPR